MDSFATNRIHHIYPFTRWRPTYYVRTEPPMGGDPVSFFEECKLHIAAGEKCIFPHWEEEVGIHPNVEFINTCHHYKYPADHKKTPQEWHLPMVCDFGTVLTAAMQIAVLKGYSRIFLVGCDLTGGHFSEKDNGLTQTELWRKAHEIAKKSCPIPIYNATIGGDLDIYERVDIEWLKSITKS